MAFYFNIFFSVLLLIGGVIGFTKGSVISLSVSGTLAIVFLLVNVCAAYQSKSLDRPKVYHHYISSLLYVCLLCLFVIRLVLTSKVMPAAPILLFSFIGLIMNMWVLHKNSLENNKT